MLTMVESKSAVANPNCAPVTWVSSSSAVGNGNLYSKIRTSGQFEELVGVLSLDVFGFIDRDLFSRDG